MQGDPAAADRRRAGAAVGLQHVAVDEDLALPQRAHVDHRPQRAADEPLDLLGAARRLALLHLPADALGRRAGSIEYSAVTQPLPEPRIQRGHVLVDRRRAQHAGAPEAHQHRAVGHVGEVALEGDGPQLVRAARPSLLVILLRTSRGGRRAARARRGDASASARWASAVAGGRDVGDRRAAGHGGLGVGAGEGGGAVDRLGLPRRRLEQRGLDHGDGSMPSPSAASDQPSPVSAL